MISLFHRIKKNLFSIILKVNQFDNKTLQYELSDIVPNSFFSLSNIFCSLIYLFMIFNSLKTFSYYFDINKFIIYLVIFSLFNKNNNFSIIIEPYSINICKTLG